MPSLVNKIGQALPQNQGFTNNGNLMSEGVSGQSGISTIGGITGNQIDQNVPEDYSSNPIKKKNMDQGLFRKNSSILSTANRNQLQINTPSALGYTSVLVGSGPNQTGPNNIYFYGNQSLADDPDIIV